MTGRPEVLVAPTGVANLASMLAGLRRAGAEPRVERDPDAVVRAARVVLPGVGAFGAGMAELRRTGLGQAIASRILGERPTLAVCLGLQLLCDASEESPGVEGLGCLPGRVTRFPADVRVPQFGWNRVTPGPGSVMLRAGHAYFANSYRLTAAPAGWTAATAEHGGPFVAALERGPVVACQFHPELSGPWGLDLLRRWIGGPKC